MEAAIEWGKLSQFNLVGSVRLVRAPSQRCAHRTYLFGAQFFFALFAAPYLLELVCICIAQHDFMRWPMNIIQISTKSISATFYWRCKYVPVRVPDANPWRVRDFRNIFCFCRVHVLAVGHYRLPDTRNAMPSLAYFL